MENNMKTQNLLLFFLAAFIPFDAFAVCGYNLPRSYKKAEVIINHNASNMNDVGKISIGFDKRTGKKNKVEFIRK